MGTKSKIKIKDNRSLRNEIDYLYEECSQVVLAKWAISLGIHILEMVDIHSELIQDVHNAFNINESWQNGKASVPDVRQAAFDIHKLARESDNKIIKTALRVAGHAVASGHMKEHAMVTSDYAIKVIGLITKDNMEAITKERQWQLDELKKLNNG